MYKVLICDDKPLILQALKENVNWKGLGCTIVGEATDGLSAKKIFIDFNPDIIVTDIRMPRINGLELTRIVKENSSTTVVILITAYDEFEYAQKALHYGAFELILKPIDDEHMYSVFQSAVRKLDEMHYNINKSRELQVQNQSLKRKMQQNNKNFIRSFFHVSDSLETFDSEEKAKLK
ncbi:MAG: response regulator [Spirochaetia bacterium]|nr:response regulator [Spirochaetia bacterium]